MRRTSRLDHSAGPSTVGRLEVLPAIRDRTDERISRARGDCRPGPILEPYGMHASGEPRERSDDVAALASEVEEHLEVEGSASDAASAADEAASNLAPDA